MSHREKLLARLADLKERVGAAVKVITGRITCRNVLVHEDNVFWELRNTVTGDVKTGSGYNLITTAGKNKLLNVASGAQMTAFTYIAIGTNNTAANASDTALGTEVARSPTQAPTNPDSATYQVQYTFPAGTGTGTIVEAGLLNASSSGTLLNRSVFTGIGKGALDELTMTIKIT